MRMNIETPVKPGDFLYFVQGTADDPENPGPGMYQARLQDAPVAAIAVDRAGNIMVRIGSPQGWAGDWDAPGSRYACLDKDAAQDWIRENRPGSVLLDGRTVKALYIDPEGEKTEIRLTASVADIEKRVFGRAATSEIDDEGYLAIFRQSAKTDGASLTAIVRDAKGSPVDVMYGPFVTVKTEKNPDGMLRLADVDAKLLPGKTPDIVDRYDPAYWGDATGMTVAQFAEALLSAYPHDAVVGVCGCDEVFLHADADGRRLTIDCEDMSQFDEYKNCAPRDLKKIPGGAAGKGA